MWPCQLHYPRCCGGPLQAAGSEKRHSFKQMQYAVQDTLAERKDGMDRTRRDLHVYE